MVSWLVYYALQRGDGLPTIDQDAPALVAASMVYFLANSWTVAIAAGLESGRPIARLWRSNMIWAAPSFPVGALIGLIIAYVVRAWTVATILVITPVSYFIFYTYRLYMGRMEAQRESTRLVTAHNVELEARVEERTERLEVMNRELIRLIDKLEAADRSKSEFVANVSHELKTPLNAIIGFSELLRSQDFGRLTERNARFAHHIHDAGEHLLAVICDLLDLSRIDAGALTLKPERFELADVCDEALDVVRLMANGKSVELGLEQAGPCLLTADRLKLKQVVVNLLTNGIKFTPEKGRVHTRIEQRGDWVVLSVTDSGIGIAADDLARIFEPFCQVESSHERRFGGTGLGLTLVRRIAELHSGRVTVESRVGAGSCFFVELPVGLPARPRSIEEGEPDAMVASLAAEQGGTDENTSPGH